MYAATKGAVEQFTRILAKDLGTKGITVNAIAPGFVNTDMVREGKDEQAMTQLLARLHPQNRVPEADEIAPTVAIFVAGGGGLG